MFAIKLNESTAARRRVPVRLVNEDGTPATGETISEGDAKLCKNGASEANHAGTLTELAGGLYFYEFHADEINTVGFLTLRITLTGLLPFVGWYQVVAYDPYDGVRAGLTSLPNAAASTVGGLITNGTGSGQLSPSNGTLLLPVGTSAGHVRLSDGVLEVDAVRISGDDAAADNAEAFFDGTGYSGANNVIPTVTTITDPVLITPGTSAGMLDVTDGVIAANVAKISGANVPHTTGKLWVLDGDGNAIATAADASAIKAKTDLLPSSPANAGSIPTVQQIAEGVVDLGLTGHTAPDTIGGRLDVVLSSRAPAATALSSNDWTPTRAGYLDRITANVATATDLATAQASIDALPTAVENATAVRSELSTELGRITGNVALESSVTSLASAVSSIPTAANNADAVRSELATELGRIDVATSTRAPASTALSTDHWTPTRAGYLDRITANVATAAALSTAQTSLNTITGKLPTSSYLAGSPNEDGTIEVPPPEGVPTAEENADAVRAELAVELSRITANVATESALAAAQTSLNTISGNMATSSALAAIVSSGIKVIEGGITADSLDSTAIESIVSGVLESEHFGGTVVQYIVAAGASAVGKLTGAGGESGIETLYAFDGTTVIANVEIDNLGNREPELYP